MNETCFLKMPGDRLDILLLFFRFSVCITKQTTLARDLNNDRFNGILLNNIMLSIQTMIKIYEKMSVPERFHKLAEQCEVSEELKEQLKTKKFVLITGGNSDLNTAMAVKLASGAERFKYATALQIAITIHNDFVHFNRDMRKALEILSYMREHALIVDRMQDHSMMTSVGAMGLARVIEHRYSNMLPTIVSSSISNPITAPYERQ